jgi:hypothetical protein
MKALPKKLLPLTLFAIAITSLFSVQPAQASYIVTLERVGFDTVVATGSGALDLTGLTFQTGGFGGSLIDPFGGNISTGASSGTDLYGGAFTGPSNFGRGFQTFANSGTGDIVGMFFNGGGLNSFLLGASELCLRHRSIGQRDL